MNVKAMQRELNAHLRILPAMVRRFKREKSGSDNYAILRETILETNKKIVNLRKDIEIRKSEE